jgi:hexosaminidase
LFDIIDEIIEVFKPSEYVHMGHDEVYQIGVCPVCKSKDAAQLYADDVNKIYNYLRGKGLKMIIWSDMLQPVSEYTKATSPAMDMIPKDILMLDFIWYFHFGKDIEDNLIEKGFSVAVGNLYSSHYPRYNTRIRKKGMLGGQISAWVATSEECMQREGKMYDYLLTAQMLWSDSYSKEYTLCYDRMIKAFMPYMRENIKGIKYPSLEEGARFETLFVQQKPIISCFAAMSG